MFTLSSSFVSYPSSFLVFYDHFHAFTVFLSSVVLLGCQAVFWNAFKQSHGNFTWSAQCLVPYKHRYVVLVVYACSESRIWEQVCKYVYCGFVRCCGRSEYRKTYGRLCDASMSRYSLKLVFRLSCCIVHPDTCNFPRDSITVRGSVTLNVLSWTC